MVVGELIYGAGGELCALMVLREAMGNHRAECQAVSLLSCLRSEVIVES